VVAAMLTVAAMLVGASDSAGDLGTRAQSLQQGISSDSGQIQVYAGKLQNLQGRLSAIESSFAVQRSLLLRIRTQLAAASSELTQVRDSLASDQRLLAEQLVSQYESPSAKSSASRSSHTASRTYSNGSTR
jgi:uncharacterized coiled-coil protein SlyX